MLPYLILFCHFAITIITTLTLTYFHSLIAISTWARVTQGRDTTRGGVRALIPRIRMEARTGAIEVANENEVGTEIRIGVEIEEAGAIVESATMLIDRMTTARRVLAAIVVAKVIK